MKKITLTLTFLSSLFLPIFVSAEEINLSNGTSAISLSSSQSSTTESFVSIKPFTLCSQEAIEKRDTDIAASRSLYNITMTNALNERKNREKLAVAIEDEKDRKDAIKISVDTYKNQTKSAQNNLTQTRKILWQNFENDLKKCREVEEETTPQEPLTKKIAEPLDKAGQVTMTRKNDEPDVKTIKGTIKGKIDTFFSLFN